jgi:Na+/proline symporter
MLFLQFPNKPKCLLGNLCFLGVPLRVGLFVPMLVRCLTSISTAIPNAEISVFEFHIFCFFPAFALGIAAKIFLPKQKDCSTSEEKQLNVASTKLANEVLHDPQGNAPIKMHG